MGPNAYAAPGSNPAIYTETRAHGHRLPVRILRLAAQANASLRALRHRGSDPQDGWQVRARPRLRHRRRIHRRHGDRPSDEYVARIAALEKMVSGTKYIPENTRTDFVPATIFS